MAEIRNRFLEKDVSGSGLSVFDFSEKKRKQEILDALIASSLLARKRLVVSRNLIGFGNATDQERVLEYLEKNKTINSDDDLVLLFWESGKIKKGNHLFKFLEKNSKKQEFEKLKEPKLSQWVLQRIKKEDSQARITKQALEKLILCAGNDSSALDNEVRKVVSFADGRMIDDDMVETLVKSNLDGNIFSTIDALGNNNKKQAFNLLHMHLERGDDPFYILSMFAYQFRNLLKVSDLKNKFRVGENEIARISKLHPFVVRKSLNQIRNFSPGKLKLIYGKLSELDLQAKTGKIGIKLGLDKFIAEL